MIMYGYESKTIKVNGDVIYDSMWSEEEKLNGGKVMDKERVIKNMRDAIEANKHIREQTNNALSQGLGYLRRYRN